MTRQSIRKCSGVLMLFLSMAFASRARGDIIGAYAGNPLDGTPLYCFGEWGGGVTGNGNAAPECRTTSTSPRWQVSLPSGAGSHSDVAIDIKGTPDLSTCCEVYVVTSSGFFSGSPVMCSGSATFSTNHSRTVTVPNHGHMIAMCWNLQNASNAVETILVDP